VKNIRRLLPRVYAYHGSVYWIEDLPEKRADGKPKQRWVRLCKEVDGMAAVHAALARLLYDKPSGVDDAIARFLADHLPTLSATAAKEYERQFKIIGKAFTDFSSVDHIKPKHVRDLLVQWRDAPTMQHHYRGRLSTFFAWCVVDGLCDVNPCREIRLKGPPKRDVQMTPAVFWAIHDAFSGPWAEMHRCAIELYYLVYQRGTDVRLLQWTQIGEASIRFRPTKTSRSSGVQVDVPLTPEIRAVIERARGLGKLKSPRYVLHTAQGAPFSARRLRDAFFAAQKRAGLSGYALKDIRPMATSAAERLGYSLGELRKALAHTSVETTETYLRDRMAVESPVTLTLPPRGK
jgi:integrase